MRNLVIMLAMPPMGFVSLLFIALCLRGRWERLGRWLSWVSLIGLVVLSLPVVSGSLLRGLEVDLPTTPPADDPPKAIVVLGGDLTRTAGGLAGARPGELTLDRMRTAAALQRRTGLPVLVTGGIVLIGAAPVGDVMALSMREDFRIPVTWTENQSANTQQNAQYSSYLLKAAGIDSVYVVTNAWHMRRAVLAFERVGIKVTAAPTDLDIPLGPQLNDFLPRTSSWQITWFALHEWIGYLWYALRPHL